MRSLVRFRLSLVVACVLAFGCGEIINTAPIVETDLVETDPADTLGRSSNVLPEDCPQTAFLSREEIAQLLDRDQHVALERELERLEAAHKSDKMCEGFVSAAYNYLGSMGLEALQRWVKARPGSYQARIAHASALKSAGYGARGGETTSKTSKEQFSGMREYFAGASAELDIADSIHPNHMFSVAVRLMLSGSSREKEQLANRFLEHDPANYIVRSRLIKRLEPRWGGTLADVRRVADDAQAYVAQNPKLRILLSYQHAFQGKIAAEKKNNELAVEHFTRALAFGDIGIAWSRRRAWANFRLGRMVPAMRDVNRAIRISPDDPHLYSLRSELRMKTGSNEKALEDLNRAIELDPKYARARRLRAWVWQGQRRWTEAVADYEASLLSSPDNDRALSQAGYIYLRWLRDPGRAIPFLVRATEVDPEDRYNWLYLAEAQEQADHAEAAGSYRRFLSLVDPQNGKDAGKIAKAHAYLDPDALGDASAAANATLPGLALIESDRPVHPTSARVQ